MKNNTYQRTTSGCIFKCLIVTAIWISLATDVWAQYNNNHYESARILDGQIEFMGNLSPVIIGYSEGIGGFATSGVKMGYGVGGLFDIKFRYELIIPYAGFYAVSTRFRIKKDKIAGGIELGRYKTMDDESFANEMVISPRLVFSRTFGKKSDITLTTKLDFLPERYNHSTWGGVSIGLGGSSKNAIFSVRPEIGLVSNLSEIGDYTYINIGVALILRFNTRQSPSTTELSSE